MPPKKIYDLPPSLTYDKTRKQFRYKNPVTAKRQYLGSDKKKAIELANKANLVIELKQRKKSLIPTFEDIVEKMLQEWVVEQAWSEDYRKIIITRLNAIKNEWGS